MVDELEIKIRKCSVEGCGKKHLAKGYCDLHYDRFRKYGDPLKITRNIFNNGVCSVKGCDGKYRAKNYCGKHYDQELKKKCINYYSNGTMECACCKESIIEFLSINHINNDGAEHRRKIGKRNIYTWLIKNNFPPGFDVKCMNCNFVERYGNLCPHKSMDKYK